MFGFLGFILLFFFLIIIIVLALVGNLVRMIFGFGKRTPKQYNPHQSANNDTSNRQSTANNANSPAGKKKIFGEDEGEYVEFEEIT